jgi:malonyl CoA-acyl carrier protein transacylase
MLWLVQAPARNALVEALETAEISMPKMPVIANITGKPYGSVEEIRAGLASQVTESVVHTESHPISRQLIAVSPISTGTSN